MFNVGSYGNFDARQAYSRESECSMEQVKQIRSLMRRLEQMSIARKHFEQVLAEGKRPLSALELWRVENFAQHLSQIANQLREEEVQANADSMIDCSGEDIPGIVDAERKLL